jgi:hypothetical protein
MKTCIREINLVSRKKKEAIKKINQVSMIHSYLTEAILSPSIIYLKMIKRLSTRHKKFLISYRVEMNKRECILRVHLKDKEIRVNALSSTILDINKMNKTRSKGRNARSALIKKMIRKKIAIQ